MEEAGDNSLPRIPNREGPSRLRLIVECGVVDLWIDRTLWLLIGLAVGLAFTNRQTELDTMLERLKLKAAIHLLEGESRDQFARLQVDARQHAQAD